MEEKEKLGGADRQLLGLIEQLKKGGIKTGVISNVGVGFLEEAFGERSSSEFFTELILSGEIGIIKPDPRIYEIAAERVGVEVEECLFFDDSPRNVEGARAVGMSAELYDGIAGCKATLSKAGVAFE